jgi:hypothetical protein
VCPLRPTPRGGGQNEEAAAKYAPIRAVKPLRQGDIKGYIKSLGKGGCCPERRAIKEFGGKQEKLRIPCFQANDIDARVARWRSGVRERSERLRPGWRPPRQPGTEQNGPQKALAGQETMIRGGSSLQRPASLSIRVNTHPEKWGASGGRG